METIISQNQLVVRSTEFTVIVTANDNKLRHTIFPPHPRKPLEDALTTWPERRMYDTYKRYRKGQYQKPYYKERVAEAVEFITTHPLFIPDDLAEMYEDELYLIKKHIREVAVEQGWVLK